MQQPTPMTSHLIASLIGTCRAADNTVNRARFTDDLVYSHTDLMRAHMTVIDCELHMLRLATRNYRAAIMAGRYGILFKPHAAELLNHADNAINRAESTRSALMDEILQPSTHAYV
jgi:hypothetical protein